jgi:hypothetical protein
MLTIKMLCESKHQLQNENSEMNIAYLAFVGVIILVQMLVQSAIARSYAKKESATFMGALLRSFCWSLITCWTIVLLGGHGFLILPIPSWVVIGFWVAGKDLSDATVIPNIPWTPIIPIMTYWCVFYFSYKRKRIK